MIINRNIAINKLKQITMNRFPKMHVSLYVSNIEETIQFYNAFFGQTANKKEIKYAKYILEEPALIISFIEQAEKVKAQFGHLGFQLETKELLEQRLTTIRGKNLPIKEEMGVSCCYALQDKFWVSDPDGYQWEVYYFHKDVAFNDPHYELKEKQVVEPRVAEKENSCCAATCC